MDWSGVSLSDVVDSLRKAEHNHPSRPWGEFFSKFSVPKDGKAAARIKCNLYYYRANYGMIFVTGTSLFLVRNLVGALSLSVLSVGALLFVDSFAARSSALILHALQRVHPHLAMKIRGRPGGHDGRSVPPGRQAVLKVAGVQRNKMATGLIASGALLALWAGVIGTLAMGSSASALAIFAHAVLRKPNLKARLNSAAYTYSSRA